MHQYITPWISIGSSLKNKRSSGLEKNVPKTVAIINYRSHSPPKKFSTTPHFPPLPTHPSAAHESCWNYITKITAREKNQTKSMHCYIVLSPHKKYQKDIFLGESPFSSLTLQKGFLRQNKGQEVTFYDGGCDSQPLK